MTFLGLLILSLSCKTEDRDLEERNLKLDSLTTELKLQKLQNDSLQRLITADKTEAASRIYFGREFDTIPNPEEFIENALKQQQDLVPMEGVLGGRMEFRQVQVITEEWVLAIYDDGHVQGKSIFKFELQPGGKVGFEEVASERPR